MRDAGRDEHAAVVVGAVGARAEVEVSVAPSVGRAGAQVVEHDAGAARSGTYQ